MLWRIENVSTDIERHGNWYPYAKFSLFRVPSKWKWDSYVHNICSFQYTPTCILARKCKANSSVQIDLVSTVARNAYCTITAVEFRKKSYTLLLKEFPVLMLLSDHLQWHSKNFSVIQLLQLQLPPQSSAELHEELQRLQKPGLKLVFWK